MGEAHIPAQQSAPGEEARLPASHEHPSRARHPEVASAQGPRSPVGLIGRVHGRGAFERFRAEGRRVSAGELWCVVVTDPSDDGVRVAYAIGKPVGPAVVRNRIRRRLRHLISENSAAWPPGSYLIGVRPRAAGSTYEELGQMLQRILNRISRPDTAGRP